MEKNILKVKRALLALFAMLLPLLASAQTKVEIEGIWYNLATQSKVAEVTSGTSKYVGNITIPSTVTYGNEVYKVTGIGKEAFYECVNLTAVIIPDGVTSIGYYAFDGCCNLQAVIIPNSVECIAPGAFFGASSLTSITIPNRLRTIEVETFAYCSSLTSIVIPNSVTSIEDEAFKNCSNLTTIIMSDNIMYIGCEAFIGAAWYDNQPDGVVYIGNVLYDYKGTMPDNTSIEVKDGTVLICDFAFDGCSGLTSISIPKSVKSIGGEALDGTAWLNSQPDGVVYLNNILYCYKGTMPNSTSIRVNDGTISISGWAFEDCEGLVSIFIPESVTSIGIGAFEDCENLASINIPKGITRIEEDTYQYCSSLTFITIPEGVTSIGREAFSGCSSLTSITIPESVTDIKEYAFCECGALNSITIPEGVVSIEEGAIGGCTDLTCIILPRTLRYVGSLAFGYCSNLTDVFCYADDVPSIELDAFEESYPENITLHVPAEALASYKATAPWSNFGKFEAIKMKVESIVLNQTMATLFEGETLALTATITPEDADDTSVTWTSSNEDVAMVSSKGKVVAIASGTATVTATANDGSGVSASCEVTVKELILGKCATPTISYVDGKVLLACETEDVEFITKAVSDNRQDYNNREFEFIPIYTLTAYATKAKYEDSDEATLTLCWIPCSEEHEKGDTNGILNIPSKPVLISTQGGTIVLNGLATGTKVVAYSTVGIQLATTTATDGTATLATGLEVGSTAIVKIGGNSVKVVVK